MKGDIKGAIIKGAWKTFDDWHAEKGSSISLFMEDLPKQEDI